MSAPFVRCAGGKRELAPDILAHMPPATSYDVYVEPFVGGGAIFFALWNEQRLDKKMVVLGDVDRDLVNLYAAVRDDVTKLMHETDKLIHEANRSGDVLKVYERERARWNSARKWRTPARHLFLRSCAWNGLWRTNKKGEMNTPWRKEAPKPIDVKIMRAMSALQGVELLDWDFRKYSADSSVYIGNRTLVYLDPPYLGDKDDFVAYTQHRWATEDAIALLKLCAAWHKDGAHVVLSNDDNATFRGLVAEHWPAAQLNQIFARRSINSDGAKRGKVPELLVVGSVDSLHVTCYPELGGNEESRAE